MNTKRQLSLGVFAYGTGSFMSGWRIPGSTQNNEDIEVLASIAATAEKAKFDLFFVADSLESVPTAHPSEQAKIDPVVLLSALSSRTRSIGLGGTVSTSFSDPYNTARSFSSLDHVTHGRAAWNVVTGSSPIGAANFGRELPPHGVRYQIADEYVGVVKKLWDSWEDDAFVRDTESGTFIDHSKVHTIDHKGKYYSVRGPLNSSRGPQGRPVIIQAGSSEAGQEFAAKHAEVIFTVQQDIDDAAAFYRGLKEKVVEAGRSADQCLIMPGVFPIVAPTREEAHAKLQAFMEYVDDKSAMGILSTRFGHDMSQFPLDGPLPELPPSDLSQSYSKAAYALAKRQNLTWRQLYNIFAVGRGYIVACGTPEDIADMMQEWLDAKAADGFIITPSHYPAGFGDFVDLVVPELQRRGLFRKEYQGHTLRDHLGLTRPASIFQQQSSSEPAAGAAVQA